MYHISLVIRLSFSFQSNPKNLAPSYKMDLDGPRSLGLFRKGKTCIIIGKLHSTESVICSHSREGKPLLKVKYIL